MMDGATNLEPDSSSEFVEVDPTGRYGRYNEILGKGASKTVYRAFDEYEGIEVAWNQVKLYDFLQSPEDLERLYCEIHLLKTLKHKNIMKLYTSWVDTANRNINFVTEMFTSGTLRQYRLKHKRVNIRAVKHWCRQILEGLLYLHSHDPPVIHRDLKCDNIFVNGNHGEVKIGDLGLAAILRKSHAAHCVGTPEFMAPEVYAEEYNELVDIYSFGMCLLEMVTFEYPYSECTHPAQIYKKVVSGRKPDALYKVKHPEVRQFVEKCLASVSHRLSAMELLDDPFLQVDDCNSEVRQIESHREADYGGFLFSTPYLGLDFEGKSVNGHSFNQYSDFYAFEEQKKCSSIPQEFEQSETQLFEHTDDESGEDSPHVDITIKGRRRQDGSIFLRLRISDKEDRVRNIYFQFDVESDTALSVATEMVAELDITDQDVTRIADMIDGEIASLVPEWKPGPEFEETPRYHHKSSFCQNCASNHTSSGSFINFLMNNPTARDLQFLNCSGNGSCAATHGRFEEITYQVDSPHRQVSNHSALTNQMNGFHLEETNNQHESPECSSSRESHSLEHEDLTEKESSLDDQTKVTDKRFSRRFTKSFSDCLSTLFHDLPSKGNHKIQQEIRWLRAKYQIKVRELRDKRLGIPKPPKPRPIMDGKKRRGNKNYCTLDLSDRDKKFGLDLYGHNRPGSVSQRARKCEADNELPNAKSSFLPHKLHRTTSLPVDAVDI